MARAHILLLAALATAHRPGCGVDDPAFASIVNAPSVEVAQQYHQGEIYRQLSGARGLQNNNFVPLRTLHAQGLSDNIRIGLVWDPVDNGDYSVGQNCGNPYTCPIRPRQCSYVGQSIYVQDAAGNEVYSPSLCEGKHLVTGPLGAARGAAMRERTTQAMNFWRQTLMVRPVQDPQITIDPLIVQKYNLTTANVSNVDLVIIMTARPSPNRPVAGYASCLQRDQLRRCTVGAFNWVPEILDVTNHNAADVFTNEMHTALHEIMHVLGGMNPGTGGVGGNSPFIDDNGAFVEPKGNVYRTTVDPAFPTKMVTKIVTPRVVNATRIGFGCPTADGFPLEDVDLGRAAHWEARLAGPEIMSYGTGSGQTYVSDLTLAYLEDTNQYIANYSMAGKLTPEITDDFKLSGISFLQGTSSSGSYTPPPAPSKGMLTWGRNAGCAFLNQHPRTGWPANYLCPKNQEYGCTADNRMSAACIVQSTYTREASCGSWYIDQNTGSLTCGTQNTCSGGSCSIATAMRYYTTDADAAAASGASSGTTATTGGFSNAMDFVPVRVGYWDCSTAIPTANVTTASEGSSPGFSNFASFFGDANDMMKFGGQARCPECRCMRSSLMELTRTVTPNFAVYGLCYRTNCYRSDYLQVAIKGQFGKNTVYWYKCPTNGGKVYITGFTGSIHCPDAETFCAMETITGIKYSEQSFVMEAIFWGTLAGITLMFLVICAFPCCRDRLIIFFKKICGAHQFPTEYEEVEKGPKAAGGASRRSLRVKSSQYDPAAEAIRRKEFMTRQMRAKARKNGAPVQGADDEGPEPSSVLPCTCASGLLIAINVATMLVGLAMIGLVIWSIYAARALANSVPILGVATFITVVGFVGIMAGRKRAVISPGPSCWLLAYFVFNITLCLLLVFVIAYNFAYTNWRVYVDKNWDTISDVLPAKYRQGATRDAQIDSAVQAVKDHISILASLGAAVLAIFLTSLVSAAKLIHIHTLASMLLTLCNNLLLAGGLLLSVVGFYLVAAAGRAANMMAVIGVVLAIGLIAITLGLVGTIAVFRKSLIATVLYEAALFLLEGLMGYGIYLFITQGAKIAGYVNGLDDDAISKIANDLGLSLSKAELVSTLQDNLNQLALATACACGVVLLLFFSGIIYYRAVAQERRRAAELAQAKPSAGKAVKRVNDDDDEGSGSTQGMGPGRVPASSPAPAPSAPAQTPSPVSVNPNTARFAIPVVPHGVQPGMMGTPAGAAAVRPISGFPNAPNAAAQVYDPLASSRRMAAPQRPSGVYYTHPAAAQYGIAPQGAPGIYPSMPGMQGVPMQPVVGVPRVGVPAPQGLAYAVPMHGANVHAAVPPGAIRTHDV